MSDLNDHSLDYASQDVDRLPVLRVAIAEIIDHSVEKSVRPPALFAITAFRRSLRHLVTGVPILRRRRIAY